ncbi:hypothetical protein [Mycolicibacterium fortuitum]|uniref:hypothetical protein n=1 Tax=Mycolicibacterium fortuitum TaxID=1766 RepID=UPI0007EAADB3|nr:hypothetical protein [Mycolicibacterium fortuitum]OBF77104.1 hypothetical protein A5751_23290 [Mycolicibacterium fortuitum]
MTPELEAIRDAMDKASGDGRDQTEAVALADAYVAAHPDEFAYLATMSIESCVAFIDVFRAQGDEDSQWRVEAWLLHHFEPQTIGGTVEAKVRVQQ